MTTPNTDTQLKKNTNPLPSLRVKPNDTFQLFIALDLSSPDSPSPRYLLTKTQATDRTTFPLISASFSRWSWSTKHFIINNSYLTTKTPTFDNPEASTRTFDNHTFNRNLLRYLLVSWSIPTTTPDGQPLPLHPTTNEFILPRQSINGHQALTDTTYLDILSIQTEILDTLSNLVRQVLENNMSPLEINKNVIEGVDSPALPASIVRILAMHNVKPSIINEGLKRLMGSDEFTGLLPKDQVQPFIELNEKLESVEDPTMTPVVA